MDFRIILAVSILLSLTTGSNSGTVGVLHGMVTRSDIVTNNGKDRQPMDNKESLIAERDQKYGNVPAKKLDNFKTKHGIKTIVRKIKPVDTSNNMMHRNISRNVNSDERKTSPGRKLYLTRIPKIVRKFYNRTYDEKKGTKLDNKKVQIVQERQKRDMSDLPLADFGSSPRLWTLLPPTTLRPDTNPGIGLAPVFFASEKPSIVALDTSDEEDVMKTQMNPKLNFGLEDREDQQNEEEIDVPTEPEPWPEPGPDWTTAYMYLGVAWFIHIYGFAFVMFLIGTLATTTLVEIFISKTVTTRGLSTSLNGLLLLFGSSRGISLVLNPYGSLNRISLLASRLMWSVGFPCLTSMLTTLLLVLVDTTKVSLGPPRYQQFHVVIKLSVCHFIVVLGSDIILSFYLQLKALLLVCQLIYVTWSILLTVGFYRVGYLISRNFKASRDSPILNADQGAQRLERLIFACGTVALCNCITHLYGAAGVFGVYSDLTFVAAWPWWVFQTLMRLEEISLCFIVLILAGKSRRECSSKGDGNMGVICVCLMKLKSRFATSKANPGNSRIGPNTDSSKRDMTNTVESWSTYGTNIKDGSSGLTETSRRDSSHGRRSVTLHTMDE